MLAVSLAAASPCTSAPALSIAANGVYGSHTAISWTPICDLDAIQLYAGSDSLPKAEKLNPTNGTVTLGALAGAIRGSVVVKIWFNSGSSAVIPVTVNDCAEATLPFQADQLVTLETPVSIAPPGCAKAASLIAYRDDAQVFKADNVSSGQFKIGDIYSKCDGKVTLSLFGIPAATPTSKVQVIIQAGANWSAADGFDVPYQSGSCAAPPQVTTEIVNSCFTDQGASAVVGALDGSAFGARALTCKSSPPNGRNVHVSYNQRLLASTLPKGDWVVTVWAKVPLAVKDSVQTGPEWAYALTRKFTDGWRTQEAGVQYITGCRWRVWVRDGETTAKWQDVDTFCLEPDVFHKLSFSFHYEDDRSKVYYKQLRVDDSRITDVSSYHIPALIKFTEYAGVVSLECEAKNVCGTTDSATYATVYDGLEIRQATPDDVVPFSTVSAASLSVGKALSPNSVATSFYPHLTWWPSAAWTLPLPTSLGDISLMGADGDGKPYKIELYAVTPNQVNWRVPSGVRNGAFVVDVFRGGKKVTRGTISVADFAPGIFLQCEQNSIPIGYWVLVNKDNTMRVLDAGELMGCAARIVPLSDPSLKSAVLKLHATGLDTTGKSAVVSAKVVKPGGSVVTLPLQYLGASSIPGVQEANIPIPTDFLGTLRISLCAGWYCSNEVIVRTR